MNSIKNKLIENQIIFSLQFTKGASFLLPDGSFCNINEQIIENDTGRTEKWWAHYQLDRFITSRAIISEDDAKKIHLDNTAGKRPSFIISLQERILRYTDNACVLNDGSNYEWENCYIDLPPEIPKDKQLEKLILWLDDRHYYNPANKRRLDVSLNSEIKTFNLNQDSTDDIIKEIRKLYNKNV